MFPRILVLTALLLMLQGCFYYVKSGGNYYRLTDNVDHTTVHVLDRNGDWVLAEKSKNDVLSRGQGIGENALREIISERKGETSKPEKPKTTASAAPPVRDEEDKGND